MNFTGQFIVTSFNLSAYEAQLDRYLTRELEKLVKVWLAAVTGRVPVWSGMARGSLLELSELVGGRIVIQPKAKSRISEGRSMGSATQEGYLITVISTVPHYRYLESETGNSPTSPWLSFPAGARAYNRAIKDVKLPTPKFLPVKI